MGMHDEYFKRMETQLKKWDADVDALNASGEKASVEARATYKEQVKALRVDRDAAYKKLREMRAAGEKAGLDRARARRWPGSKGALPGAERAHGADAALPGRPGTALAGGPETP